MTAIESNNILEGFRLALESGAVAVYELPLFNISSMLMGKQVSIVPSYGKRWSAFLAQMESFSSGTSTPVIEFPAYGEAADLAGLTVSVVENMIIRQSSMPSNVATGLKYMIDECVENILEHSRSEYGYISSFCNLEKKWVEICIADKGVTVLGSYKAVNDPDIKTDLEALQAANRGISTKNRPNAENRGYGLRTTQQMVVSGLGGSFAMISGGTFFVNDNRGRRFLDSSDAMKIPGTIVVMRLPYINPNFRYINYIE